MKILFVLADNVYLTPYLNKYIARFSKESNTIKILFWDKNNNERELPSNYKRYYDRYRVLGYLKFRRYIIEFINKEQFDFIIPLHQSAILLISDVLIKKYKNKYIFDVRDYSYEKYRIIKKIQKKLVENSRMNIISSEGYTNFLPHGKYYITHNLPNIENIKCNNRKKHFPIRISYIGLIRFMEQNKKIIDFFKNDNRFLISFIGTNSNLLKEYCEYNNVNNVELIDTFNPKDTLKFYDNTDVIMNLYGNHTPLLDYAISNKFYYALLLKKPILVCEDTFMEKVALKAEVGFVLKMKSETEKDDLFEYYNDLDFTKLETSCEKYLKKVYFDEELLDREINKIIEENGCD